MRSSPAPLQRDRRFVVRKTMLWVAAVALALSLAAGAAAFAQTPSFGAQGQGVSKTCPEDCDGTTFPDTLTGTDAPNHINGLGGNDSIMVKDGQMDMVDCGGGNDSVTRDSIDVLSNC